MLRACWLAAYVCAILLANIFLDSFIGLPGFGLFSIGSIFFAAVFTLRDRLHAYGLPTVYLAIGLALLVTAAYGQFIAHVPPRFLLASFAAILAGELADTAMFQRLRHRRWHARVLASNAVSVPLDSTAFTVLAFAGAMSVYDMTQIIYADVIGKFLIAAVLAWLPFMQWERRRQQGGTGACPLTVPDCSVPVCSVPVANGPLEMTQSGEKSC
ncbi:VUT family protein [Kerstersia similis]|uniref:VUT family protein n=1 Tax=Kerstersia similis TaxID=206505 RepID=UPI0039F0C366